MNFRSATANQQKNEDDLESFFGTGSRPSSATRPKPSSSDPFFDSQFPKKQSESVRTSNGSTVSMRNVVNLTVSRVIALYYLRGMQANTKFCFQRALTRNLGSASLGSLFVPSIEALRIVARELNLLEGEDEFMFSCAHCCLNVMQSVFKFGNSWAYVQIAAYGKSFTKASIDTWEVFQRHSQEMEVLVDSDITSALCFLSGVCSGALCVIMVAAWTAKVHQGYIATISLLAFFVGYLMGVSAVKAFYELLSQSTMSELHHEAKKPVAPAELCPILKTLYKILITRELSSQSILQALRDETMNDPRELIKMGQTHVFYIPSLLGDHQ